MFEMIIYKDELEIADLIRKNNIISHLSECSMSDETVVSDSILSNLKAAEEQRKNFDLYHLQSILVSSVWNGNDDYFCPSELWAAKNTAKDKPFNIEHECDNIIGHMVGSYAINDTGKMITDDTVVDNLPDIMHLVSHAVIYKYWDKPEKQEYINKILAELKDNTWFVSVECLFPTFDYLLKSDAGTNKLIARNSDTAFLTKYLKAYGGKGVYGNDRIARVPRNLILSGKGLVRKPANKNSIIFNKLFELSKNNIKLETSLVYEKEEVNKMDANKEKEYQDTITKLQTEYNQLKASFDADKINKVQLTLDSVTKDLDAKKQELEVVKASLEKVNTEKSELTANYDKLIAEKKKIEDELAQIQATQKENNRIQLCKNKLAMNDEDAKVYAASLNKLDDKAFEDHVEWQVKFVAKAGKVQETVVTDTKVLDKITPTDSKDATNTQKDVSLTVASVSTDNAKKVAEKFSEFLVKTNFRKVTEKPKFQNV